MQGSGHSHRRRNPFTKRVQVLLVLLFLVHLSYQTDKIEYDV